MTTPTQQLSDAGVSIWLDDLSRGRLATGTLRKLIEGMSTEDQEQAFTKFFRSARSRETAIPGAGLGLPISKTIVEGHGGAMSLTSAPGAGTTATFVLPVS